MLCLNTVYPIKTSVFCHSLEKAETLYSSSSEVKIYVRKRGKFKSLFTDNHAFNHCDLIIDSVSLRTRPVRFDLNHSDDSLKRSHSEMIVTSPINSHECSMRIKFLSVPHTKQF